MREIRKRSFVTALGNIYFVYLNINLILFYSKEIRITKFNLNKMTYINEQEQLIKYVRTQISRSSPNHKTKQDVIDCFIAATKLIKLVNKKNLIITY